MASRWLTDRPQNLAVFRVMVCAVELGSAEVHDARRWATAATTLRAGSPAWSFPLAWIPVTSQAANVAYAALIAGCALGLVGLATRPALAVAAISATYLLGIPQLVGAVTHDHHLVWFLCVLAASPCGDALSIDAMRAGRRGRPHAPPRSAAYGFPLWTARLLVGVVFLFPGLWKLRESGWQWIASDNFRNQMWLKWYELGWVPALRVDRYPALCRALAFAGVAFELAFLPMALHRRTRPWAAVAAFAFHAGTQELMGIRFASLWLTYVVFFDPWYWARRFGLTRRLRRVLASTTMTATMTAAATATTTATASCIVGAALLAGAGGYGFAGAFQAWPFACYPTFQWIASDEIPHLAIDAIRDDGTIEPIAHRPRSQKEWGLEWSLVGLIRGPAGPERLEAWWNQAADERRRARELGAVRVRFYRAWSATDPARWSEPPRRRELLTELEP